MERKSFSQTGREMDKVEGLDISKLAGVFHSDGGTVEIIGEGVREGVRIGFGVAKFLAGIPAEGFRPSQAQSGELYLDSNTYTSWIEEDLIPNGLVRETAPRSRVYVRTETANNVIYNFIPNRRMSSEF